MYYYNAEISQVKKLGTVEEWNTYNSSTVDVVLNSIHELLLSGQIC